MNYYPIRKRGMDASILLLVSVPVERVELLPHNVEAPAHDAAHHEEDCPLHWTEHLEDGVHPEPAHGVDNANPGEVAEEQRGSDGEASGAETFGLSAYHLTTIYSLFRLQYLGKPF